MSHLLYTKVAGEKSVDSLLHLLYTEGGKQEKEGLLIPALEAEGKGGVGQGQHSPAGGQLAVHTDQAQVCDGLVVEHVEDLSPHILQVTEALSQVP